MGNTTHRALVCNERDKVQPILKGVVMHTTKRGLNRLIKDIIEMDDLISGSATAEGIVLNARFCNKRATIDSVGNILINVSISQNENPKVDLETAAYWASRPITIAMECR
jgi:hypothetical protein